MTMKQARKKHRRRFLRHEIVRTGKTEERIWMPTGDYLPFRFWIRKEAPHAASPKLREILRQ